MALQSKDTPMVKIQRDPFLQAMSNKWNYKIGRIAELYMTPCINGDSPWLWAAAIAWNTPQFFASFTTLDCTDYAWDKANNAFGPFKRRARRRHGRGGSPRVKADQEVPGSVLPRGGLAYAAWALAQVAQKIGFGMILIDATLDFGINFQMTYAEWNGCGTAPEINGLATVAQRVYGAGGPDVRTDLVQQGPNSGIVFGIGGFACTVPTGNLRAMGGINTAQFLTTKYVPLQSCEWVIYNPVNGQPYAMTEWTGNSAQVDGTHTAQASAEINLPAAQGCHGYLLAHAPAGDEGGGIYIDSPCTFSGAREGFLWGRSKPDPCSNMIAGVPPRR
jgi:hypothetical protein